MFKPRTSHFSGLGSASGVFFPGHITVDTDREETPGGEEVGVSGTRNPQQEGRVGQFPLVH